MTVNQQLEAYVENTRARFEDLLGQMVEIPSISMDPARANEMRRMAILAMQVLTDAGAEARIVETGGYPLVSGGWITGTHHPTVTIYNHMDVQPAQEPEWQQDPFAFKNEGGI
ncbi:MAG TPA: peptidase, partial [Nitrospira sp.]|nr:peptidase [Nitrospira sp.]